jgi:hypothetical protein
MGITSSIYAATCEQANNDTGRYSKNKVDMRIVYDTPLQILSSVQDQQEKTKQRSKVQKGMCILSGHHLGHFEPILLSAPPLRRVREHLCDDLGEWVPDLVIVL